MAQMKDSGIGWIGDIPEDWNMISNRYLFQYDGKKVGNNSTDYSLLSLTTGGVREKDINETGGKVPTSYDGYQTVKSGQMIFCLFDLDCSSVFSGLSKYNGMITSAYDVFSCTDLINSSYADYFFQYVFSNRYYKMYSKNIRYTITSDTFASIKTPVPSHDEQDKISVLLDNKIGQAKMLVDNLTNQIDKLKEYKKALITKCVTKGLDPNVLLKDSGVLWIREIPNNWTITTCKNKFSFAKGLSITKDDLIENGISVISYGQIHSKDNKGTQIDDSLIRYVDSDYLIKSPQSMTTKNCFIFADTSEDLEGSGNCVFVDRDNVFAGYHTIIFKPNEQRNMKYFAYLFQSDDWRYQIRSRVYGVKLFSITQKILANADLLIPPDDEQERIVNYLDKTCSVIDSLISSKQQQIDKLNEYQKSLIYEYVTGKKEVI